MRLHMCLAIVLSLLAALGTCSIASACTALPQQDVAVRAVDGEWIYVEDRTEGRDLERQGPPMASKFSLRVEEGESAVILNGHGSGHRDVRIALDGATTDVTDPKSIAHYRGSWKDGTFEYEVTFERLGDSSPQSIKSIRRSFRSTPEGLIVTVVVNPPVAPESVALYQNAENIEMPKPTNAKIDDVAWLAGAWVGTRASGSSNEERWSPPLGGAMLAVSRSVNTSGKMFAFEYLRIVERGDGLVYIAQPGGAKATEFVLTEVSVGDDVAKSPKRAVFENPRHDYPKRIVYELSAAGELIATIGYSKGGTPRRFEFTREAN